MDLHGFIDEVHLGGPVGSEAISSFVDAVVNDGINDTELESVLRAIFECGLPNEDTVSLTSAMMQSGDMLTWPKEMRDKIVDKHSTGGVGDKVSIPLAPALAACGLYVPMISGRGLGHTGGTLDKLESIPGFNVEMGTEEIQNQVAEIGVAIIGQTPNLVPADRRMYAVRDVTDTVASIPLITSSIVSKKAAEQPAALVLDVKHGRAAFKPDREQSRELARSMVAVADGLGIDVTAVLTTMDHPLGCAIGNSVEIVESIECLRGAGPNDLEEVVCTLGGVLLASTKIAPDIESGAVMILDSLTDGSAFDVFLRMAIAQGANANLFESDHSLLLGLGLLDENLVMTEIITPSSGWISDIDAMALALVSLDLGAGRKNLGDTIDHAVGMILDAQVGEWLDEGEAWVTVQHRDTLNDDIMQRLGQALTLTQTVVKTSSRIDEIFGPEGINDK